jgi:bifunctional non-homologous end joining protein LigD
MLSVQMTTIAGVDLGPQRPRFKRQISEPDGHVLEPEWEGRRALVRLGHPGPRFVGYAGPIEGPRELYDAITVEARCSTAILDGVLVDEFKEERELELDAEGNAFVRQTAPRTIFAAFDILEVDGQILLDVPLLERKRQLEGVLVPSPNVRLTAYRSRDLRSWRETLQEQGFHRVVVKDWNSTYEPGRTAESWTVVEKIRELGRR